MELKHRDTKVCKSKSCSSDLDPSVLWRTQTKAACAGSLAPKSKPDMINEAQGL